MSVLPVEDAPEARAGPNRLAAERALLRIIMSDIIV
jgi:hypothetical protein